MSISRGEVNELFHESVDYGTGNSADYVVKHGLRQDQRGKKPSVAYRGISNPKLALDIARKDLDHRKEQEASIGDGWLVFIGKVAVINVVTTPDSVPLHVKPFMNTGYPEYGPVGVTVRLHETIDTLPAPEDRADGTVQMSFSKVEPIFE